MTAVVLCTPSVEPPRWCGVASWFRTQVPDPYAFRFIYELNKPLLEAQNSLVRRFLAEPDNEWMFMVEDDMVYLPGTLGRLLSWGEPVVSALYFKRDQPHIPHVYRGDCGGGMFRVQIEETLAWLEAHRELARPCHAMIEERPADALAPVDFTGMGCVVIQRRVLEAMRDPWFFIREGNGRTSDKYFYQEAIRLGFQPYVDRSVVCGHLARDVQVGALDFIAYTHVVQFSEEESNGTGSE